MRIGAIYCDMDQVLVNFLKGAKLALGKEFNDPTLGTDEEKWKLIAKIPFFWVSLEWMPNAEMLWQEIKNQDTCVLSAAPSLEKAPDCPAEKKLWCQTNLKLDRDRVIIVERSEKQLFAKDVNGTPNLLIDDHPKK